MATKYYYNLWEIEDVYRRKKYAQLLLASLQNDVNKWREIVTSDRTVYESPDYNGSIFRIEFRLYFTFTYIFHRNPPITDRPLELIGEKITKDLEAAIEKLRETIYTPEVYEIEKLIGNKHSRKEKLEFLEIEQIKENIEDTYNDWLVNETENSAKLIAKLMYYHRKDEDVYNLWLEKFNDIDLVMSELKK